MDIVSLVKSAHDRNASDLHLKVGVYPVLRINGELLAQEDRSVITEETMQMLLKEVTTEEQQKTFTDELEADFAYHAEGIGRFRINACLQDGTISLSCRPVSMHNPTIEELGLPEVCKDLVLKTSGLVLVTGLPAVANLLPWPP